MDIAMVFDGLNVGGAERVGTSYAQLLCNLGHTVTVFNVRPELTAFEKLFPPSCGIDRIRFPHRFAPEYHTNLVRSSYIRRLAYPFAYAALSAANAIYRLVCRLRYPRLRKEYDLAIAFSGHMNDLTFVADRFVRAKHTVCWLHGALYQYIIVSSGYLNLYKKIRNLVCLSERDDVDCTVCIQQSGIKKIQLYNPCVVNADGVDPDRVSELRAGYGDFCLMVGRLAPEKDQETVIRAMKYMRDELGLHKKLVLVGDGPERGRLETLTTELGMSDDVLFAGTRDDVQNYYSAAGVYVHAAPQEGLPTVFLEAMAFGLPIASTDAVPGAREILGDDRYGLVSPNADPAALAENIRRIYTDDALRASLIEAEGRRIRDFDPDVISARLQEYLSSLAENARD